MIDVASEFEFFQIHSHDLVLNASVAICKIPDLSSQDIVWSYLNINGVSLWINVFVFNFCSIFVPFNTTGGLVLFCFYIPNLFVIFQINCYGFLNSVSKLCMPMTTS